MKAEYESVAVGATRGDTGSRLLQCPVLELAHTALGEDATPPDACLEPTSSVSRGSLFDVPN